MKTFVVGGAVRDRLMGLTPKDVDYVVVGSTPEEMLSKGFKQVGADFPVFLSEDGTEYALARTERKSGRGYNGFETDASPTVTLEQDCARRDLTINSMASSTDESIVFDPFNGREDIKNRMLRHVSAAFADDPVRVLRLARFHARFGEAWRVAPETMEFARKMVEDGELAFLTRERVLLEYEKALSEPSPHLFFRTLRDCGALAVVFPEFDAVSQPKINVTARSFSYQSKRYNHAKLTSILEHPENFEKRLNVSVADRAYASLFRQACRLSNEKPVDRLHSMDVFRQTALWEAFMEDTAKSGLNMDFLVEAYNATKHVCFETLPEEARLSLQGKAIGDAIKSQRKFAYESAQRLKA
jgi:tRNA nucleotidyltransferase/poly(A) polymerase